MQEITKDALLNSRSDELNEFSKLMETKIDDVSPQPNDPTYLSNLFDGISEDDMVSALNAIKFERLKGQRGFEILKSSTIAQRRIDDATKREVLREKRKLKNKAAKKARRQARK